MRNSRIFESIHLNGTTLSPALFLAPMAGITNSAFRRLLSDFGGYGALTTEMLSPSAFLHEDPNQSAFSRRRECEGPVIYQLRTSGEENLEAAVAKLERQNPLAIDLNLGCPAPEIQKQASGAALFRDFPRLEQVLKRIRACYTGTLTVKCRLGDDPENWRAGFLERLRLFEDYGVHAITVHPRFSGEKLKRRARWHEFPWIAAQTRLPVIGNGDIRSLEDIEKNHDFFSPLAGLMLGRIAAQKPWIFREFTQGPLPDIDYAGIWLRLYDYTLEDLPPERAIGRLKEFTTYYAHNFFFGHELFRGCLKARSVEEVRDAAVRFFDTAPELAGHSRLHVPALPSGAATEGAFATEKPLCMEVAVPHPPVAGSGRQTAVRMKHCRMV
ncbi:MAG: tRNA-dihydrouridine synthase family protein [Acidobacteriota bacterium]|jgi:tRNA-dihydrouridine synthase|nr:tRNA-dihydrouridine synthase family protein [Acidobacteriota bacterium]